MARQSRGTVSQVVHQSPSAPVAAPIAAPVAPPAPMIVVQAAPVTDADRYAFISARPYNSWTAEEKALVERYEGAVAKISEVARLGRREQISFSPDDPNVFTMDIRVIDLNHPQAKRDKTGTRRYLWSLDGFEFDAFGITWQAGTFYALQKAAK